MTRRITILTVGSHSNPRFAGIPSVPSSPGGGGSGATSVVTDNGDGTYTHNDGTGTVVTIDTREGVSADPGNSLTVGTDLRPFITVPDEVVENAGPLTGAAPAGAQWGVDTTSGQAYYVSGGNWTVMPVSTVDLNTTVHNPPAGTTKSFAPLFPPSNPDVGDLHLESYDDYLVWWRWDGTLWSEAASIATNPALGSNVPPAADDAVGAVGTSVSVAREDHKHPAQGVSADAGNELTVGTDGLHFFKSAAHLFLGNTAVAPATAGAPTLAEITAAVGSAVDVVAYYTGDDTSTSTPTHVYHVDSAGDVKVLKEPAAPTKYKTPFVAADWTLSAGAQSITFAAATHGIADPSSVAVWSDNGTSLSAVTTEVSIDNATKDVTISITNLDAAFNGVVHIS